MSVTAGPGAEVSAEHYGLAAMGGLRARLRVEGAEGRTSGMWMDD